MIEALGWIAVVLYVGDHIYVSAGRGFVPRVYFAVNLVAALAFIVSSGAMMSWQSVTINAFWAIISVLALMGIVVDVPGWLRRVLTWGTVALGLASLVVLPLDRMAAFAAAGWAGVALYCSSYFLLADKAITRPVFLVLNIFAALFLVPAYFIEANWPALGMSVSWTIVSAGGLLWDRRAATADQLQ